MYYRDTFFFLLDFLISKQGERKQKLKETDGKGRTEREVRKERYWRQVHWTPLRHEDLKKQNTPLEWGLRTYLVWWDRARVLLPIVLGSELTPGTTKT